MVRFRRAPAAMAASGVPVMRQIGIFPGVRRGPWRTRWLKGRRVDLPVALTGAPVVA